LRVLTYKIPLRELIATTSSASDDLQNPEKLRSLLKDLREARQAKSRDGLKDLDHSELSVWVTRHSSFPILIVLIFISFLTFVQWR